MVEVGDRKWTYSASVEEEVALLAVVSHWPRVEVHYATLWSARRNGRVCLACGKARPVGVNVARRCPGCRANHERQLRAMRTERIRCRLGVCRSCRQLVTFGRERRRWVAREHDCTAGGNHGQD